MFARLAFPRPTVAALALAAAVAALAAAPAPARAQATQRIVSSEERPDRVVHLALSKSKILDFDEEIRDILVSDPKIADAVVRSSKRLYLIGNKFGTTNVVVFGANGRAVANLEIQVEIDTGALETLLRRLMPKSNIKVEAVRGTVVLSGTVASSTDAIQAHEVASRFVGADPKLGATTTGSTGASAGSDASGSAVQVVNALTIGGKDQVMLKVTIAEIQREAVKKLGINISGSGTQGNWSGSLATANTFPITPAVSPSATAGVGGTFGPWSLSANLKALEQNSLIKTLAEPNLSALSGEQAQFLVGGEYPVPVSQSSGSSGNTIGVEFKTYGIALNFQPVVLADDRINLTVKTEVSELTSDGAVTIGSLTIPALRVRRASTTLELPSGGAMVLGGLLKDDARQAIVGTPGLASVPILGTLFRSRDFQHSQSELVIFIQPLVVRPVAASKLQRPDQNFRPAGDAAAMFMGRLNRVYRTNGQSSGSGWAGRVGYIFD